MESDPASTPDAEVAAKNSGFLARIATLSVLGLGAVTAVAAARSGTSSLYTDFGNTFLAERSDDLIVDATNVYTDRDGKPGVL